MILLSMCACLWRTRYRDSRIFIGTSQPLYSPLSNKQMTLAHEDRYRDEYHTEEAGYYRSPPVPSGGYGFSTAGPPAYDDVVKNFQQGHQK